MREKTIKYLYILLSLKLDQISIHISIPIPLLIYFTNYNLVFNFMTNLFSVFVSLNIYIIRVYNSLIFMYFMHTINLDLIEMNVVL